jgi:predicted permease
MQAIPHVISLTSPLFLLAGLGYALVRWLGWPKSVSDALTRFVFAVAIPAVLFRLMSDFSRLPPVDARLLIAYFGGCLLVFVAGRAIASRLFKMDGVQQSVFGVGGIFANNLLLGLPLATILLGDAALPVVSLVLVFNSLLLWTLVTISIEWARTRHVSLAGFANYAEERGHQSCGRQHPDRHGVGLHRHSVAGHGGPHARIDRPGGDPAVADRAGYGTRRVRRPRRLAGKQRDLCRQARLASARGIRARPPARLPPLETRAVVLLASLPVGANVYLMAREFGALPGPVAASLVLSTVAAAVTTPIVLALMAGS